MNQPIDVVTVTLNPAIDQTISVPNFTAGEVNRVTQSQSDPGGKGVNVASFLTDDGFTVAVTGFLGRQNDGLFREFFERKGIVDRFVRIAGQTRTGIKIVDPVNQRTTDINFSGQSGTPEDVQTLFQILEELATVCDWFVLSGSIPANTPVTIYRDLIQMLRGRHKHVVLDTSGGALREALVAGPYLIKPNIDELRELTGAPLDTQAAIVAAAQQLSRRHDIQCLVVSMGKQGAIFVEGDEVVLAVPPAVEVKSTVGAGDAMVAGTVSGKLRGYGLADCARRATAFSVDTIAHVGSELSSREAIEVLTHQVTVHVLSR